MPAVFLPSLDDIAYAERILLPPGESFDEERRRFICDMGTLDLLAVPGSGKTTALLAKLLILDRHLPRMDGAGILVISHTNAAVDEIRDRIGAHCTQLFRYPNFIGTIQRFVDEFLAVPYYVNRYKKAPLYIDDVAYEARFSKPPFAIKGFIKQENNNALRCLRVNVKRIRWSWIDGKEALTAELPSPATSPTGVLRRKSVSANGSTPLSGVSLNPATSAMTMRTSLRAWHFIEIRRSNGCSSSVLPTYLWTRCRTWNAINMSCWRIYFLMWVLMEAGISASGTEINPSLMAGQALLKSFGKVARRCSS